MQAAAHWLEVESVHGYAVGGPIPPNAFKIKLHFDDSEPLALVHAEMLIERYRSTVRQATERSDGHEQCYGYMASKGFGLDLQDGGLVLAKDGSSPSIDNVGPRRKLSN